MATLDVQPLALRELSRIAARLAAEVAPMPGPRVGGSIGEALASVLSAWERHDLDLARALDQHAASVAGAASLYAQLEQRLIRGQAP